MTRSRPQRLTTAQAAARLAVKPATLYAYVSRGQVTSRRSERGGSTFDPLEIEALASSRAERRSDAIASSGREGRPLVVLDSPITLVEPDRLLFRGEPAAALAEHCTFEQAVARLWALPAGSVVDLAGAPEVPPLLAAMPPALIEQTTGIDLLRLALLTAEAATRSKGQDPLEVGASVLGTFVDALPDAGPVPPPSAPLARRLWAKLSDRRADPAEIALLDAALVLSMDHDLAASTMAARVAASARAAPHACLAAALAAVTGTLHGGVGVRAVDLLTATMASRDPEGELADSVAAGDGTPGFGHVIYRQRDPRAEALFARMRSLARYAAVLIAVRGLGHVVQARLKRPANIDLALAALAVGAGFRPDAGTLIFAIARTAGWTAHIADEYAQVPLRLRPQARYTGPDRTKGGGPRLDLADLKPPRAGGVLAPGASRPPRSTS